MYTIDLTIPIKNANDEGYIDGETPVLLGAVLVRILDMAREGGKYKLFNLAVLCAKEKKITIDASDFSLIRNAVEKTDVYPSNIVIGRVLEILEASKVEKE